MPRSRRYGTSSRACANPNSGVSWRRYVARSSGTSQDGDRPRLDRHVGARNEAVAVATACGERELPVRAEPPRGEPERDVLEVRVEQQKERLVAERLAAPP